MCYGVTKRKRTVPIKVNGRKNICNVLNVADHNVLCYATYDNKIVMPCSQNHKL